MNTVLYNSLEKKSSFCEDDNVHLIILEAGVEFVRCIIQSNAFII